MKRKERGAMTNQTTAIDRSQPQAIEQTGQSPVNSPVSFRPVSDVFETDEAFFISADMPGTSSDAIDLCVEGQTLTVHARVQPRYDSNARAWLGEYGVGDFRRAFRIGENVDTERIDADYQNGVLTIRLPKHQDARPRRIEVRGG
jgi:HSP20 family protein